MRDVFISYARSDAAIAEQIASRLKASDVSVFFDQTSLVGGEEASKSVTEAIERARAVVVILSKDASSRVVESELAHALEARKDLIPVLHGPAATENWIWPLVAGRSPVTVESPGDLKKVVDRVRQSLGAAPRDYRAARLATVPIAAGLVAAAAIGGRDAGSAALWATALLSAGASVGFLFGIPRRKRSHETAAADSSGAAFEVNTNLEEISDWLTKILVAAALVEAKEIPAYFRAVVTQIAASLPSVHGATPFATTLVVYCTSVGFVTAYLLARVYLIPIVVRSAAVEKPALKRSRRRPDVE